MKDVKKFQQMYRDGRVNRREFLGCTSDLCWIEKGRAIRCAEVNFLSR